MNKTQVVSTKFPLSCSLEESCTDNPVQERAADILAPKIEENAKLSNIQTHIHIQIQIRLLTFQKHDNLL